ncbi:major facilitator superfamily domain-containing protein [Lasiosphaeria miniovina]|uniref:Major facilitator superfamily domain-containing protein n=1 Tax=Lasiosphaeria miniovina TaxID=1954250 RepID=A0AA40ADM2_9PEZI|nr:major facilitator superfamily domain-containing protein [Lasiosphaeria miniovina]KAK0713926.1 major facilitator superfamily domain-containing protein [Lasiosphaeria miniovina]
MAQQQQQPPDGAVSAEPATEHSPLLNHVHVHARANGSPRSPSADAGPPANGHGAAVKHAAPADEEQARAHGDRGFSRAQVARIISVLLIGVFVANADGSLLMATHPIIASDFNELSASSWLITSFSLAAAATQTLYGKLSDIYGRKWLVIVAYSVFALGCAIISVGQTMWQVVLGRVISGAGASGMTTLVSVLITDMLPIREVAQWRSFVNIIATTGRSVGGPLGGWLADVIGWRWSFSGQVPVIGVAIVLCAIYLPGPNSAPAASTGTAAATPTSGDNSSTPLVSRKSKFSRIDFKGSFVFALMILALLFPMELGGVTVPWSHPLIAGLFVLSAALLAVFIAVERRAPEPILPLDIFNRDASFSFLIMGLQSAAQIGLMFTVPIYFKVTASVSNTSAGAHLVPAVVANAVGGVLSGLIINRSGKYKFLVIFAVACSSCGYLLLMLTWHGHTNWFESLYIMPGGFGTGIAQSAVFISLQAVVDPAHMAPAVAFMYLSSTVWFMVGLAATNAVLQTTLRRSLLRRLLAIGLDHAAIQKIIASAISDVDFVDRMRGAARTAVISAYVDALWWSHGVPFICSVTALGIAIFLKQRRIDR